MPRLKLDGDLVQVQELLPAFKEKFLAGTVKPGRWGTQIWEDGADDVNFWYAEEELSVAKLRNHFSGQIAKFDGHEEGSIGVRGAFEFDRVKWYCADLDFDIAVQVARTLLLPVLDKHGIEYIWEYGGPNFEKAHLWIFCNTSRKLLKRFVEILYEEAKIDRKVFKKIEHYPTRRPRNLIRVPGGVHLRSRQVMPVEFRGKRYSSPSQIMKAIIKCKRVDEGYMADLIGKQMSLTESLRDPSGRLSRVERDQINHERQRYDGAFVYRAQNLPNKGVKDSPLKLLKTLVSECQAWNKLANMSEPEDMGGEQYLDEAGGDVHDWGLCLHSGLDASLNIVQKQDPDSLDEAEEWVERYKESRRTRDDESHKWNYKSEDGPSGHYVWRCETMDDKFDYCKGCIHRGRPGFSSPIQLYYGRPLKMVPGEKKLMALSNEEISKIVMAEAKQLIMDAYKRREPLDLFVGSGLGTYKSTELVIKYSARLARAGAKVLIAVPRGDLGMAQKEAIEKLGVDAFFVGSHQSLFEHFEKSFECPSAEPIQLRQAIGISKRSTVQRYCKGCEFRPYCPFPSQYTNARDSKARVVIIQHAHFTVRTALNVILQKEFDFLFVDETFIDNIYEYVKVTPLEAKLLMRLSKKYEWAKKLVDWFRGFPPQERLEVPIKILKKLKRIFDEREAPWNMRTYIDHYNRGKLYEKNIGLFRFSPLPNIPIKVFTNATAPEEYLKRALHKKDIKIIGREYLTDVTHYNPKNKMIKVVDGSTSKSALANENYFENVLRFIAWKAQTEYKRMTILVTVYAADVDRVRQFFDSNFAKESKRITVATMAVGVNTWRDINVQFHLCGIHLNLLQMRITSWVMQEIENYWRAVDGKSEILNPYPHMIKGNMQLPPNELKYLTVRAKMKLGEDDYRLVEFPDLKVSVPREYGLELVHWMALLQTQQARRIRTYFRDDKELGKISDEKHYWQFSNRYEPNTLYNEVRLASDCFAEAGLLHASSEIEY